MKYYVDVSTVLWQYLTVTKVWNDLFILISKFQNIMGSKSCQASYIVKLRRGKCLICLASSDKYNGM